MGILRDILEVALAGIRSEARYRREHPEKTAKMFRDREAHWKRVGRPGLARVAARRAARWEARIPKEVTPPCPEEGKEG